MFCDVYLHVPLQIYPYLVVNDACLTESRREERVLQLLRMLNHFLAKQKVTNTLNGVRLLIVQNNTNIALY